MSGAEIATTAQGGAGGGNNASEFVSVLHGTTCPIVLTIHANNYVHRCASYFGNIILSHRKTGH